MPEMWDMVRPTRVLAPDEEEEAVELAEDVVMTVVVVEDPLLPLLPTLADKLGEAGGGPSLLLLLPPPLDEELRDLLGREEEEVRLVSESSTRRDGRSSSCCLSKKRKWKRCGFIYGRRSAHTRENLSLLSLTRPVPRVWLVCVCVRSSKSPPQSIDRERLEGRPPRAEPGPGECT